MKKFKEFISDNLRYIILIVGIIVLVGGIYLGFRMITPYVSDETQTEEKSTEKISETSSETTKPTEKITEKSTEKKTEKESNKKTEKQTEKQTEKPTEKQTQKAAESETTVPETNAPETNPPETNPPETTAPETEYWETEPVQTESQEPQWITILSTAYIREAPSYEGAILGELSTGTSMLFLEDVGGWYKVEVDGMVGYVGARFF